ncbi:MAG: TlpA family protein disulfide reductase [Acidimicrobiales bacterium]
MDPQAPPTDPGPRRHLARWVGAGALVVVALVAGALTIGRDAGAPDARTRRGSGQAPPIELPRLDADGTVSLGALRGQPVVVNFFASWCAPCVREMPGFQAVADRLGSRVAFLGVDHQDNRQGGLKILSDTGVRYPSGYDPDGKVAADYGLFGMPTTVFVAADGRLLETHTGEMSKEKLEAAIARLFGI